MNIYNKSSVISFYTKHSAAKIGLLVWFDDVSKARWKTPNEIKKNYKGGVSILKNNRVIFDIKGNDYRIVTAMFFEQGWLFIKFIGTHSEYDKIDANTVDLY